MDVLFSCAEMFTFLVDVCLIRLDLEKYDVKVLFSNVSIMVWGKRCVNGSER